MSQNHMATANAMSNVVDGRLYSQVITCSVTHSYRGAHTQHYINRKQKGPIVAQGLQGILLKFMVAFVY